MTTTLPIIDLAAVLTLIGLLAVFALAGVMARYTVVYRRNNLAVLLALILSAAAAYCWGSLGLLFFAAGTMNGARSWLSEIRTANDRVSPTDPG